MYYVEKVQNPYNCILSLTVKCTAVYKLWLYILFLISYQQEAKSVNVCILQCVSGTDSWQRVNTELPVKSPRFALFDLSEGKSYCFRVRCCNSAGVGEPSDPTEPTQVGDKLGMDS